MHYRTAFLTRYLLATVFVASFFLLPLDHAGPSHAAGPGGTIIVTSSLDNNIADDVLTLREAILVATGGTDPAGLNRPLTLEEARTATIGCTYDDDWRIIGDCGEGLDDIIRFSATATYITLVADLPPITDTGMTTITGLVGTMYATVDGSGSFHGFDIRSNNNVVMRLSLTNLQDYGIRVSGNGNLVANLNIGAIAGSGIVFDGGGGANGATLTVASTTFTGNSAGAITSSGTLAVVNSVFFGNHAGNAGGGISNSGTLTVTNSLFSDNTAGSDGGGIYHSAGTAVVSNSTFAGNSAGSSGGGLYAASTLTIANSSFSRNSASAGSSIHSSGTTTVNNTILAHGLGGPNCDGLITNGGNNIDDGTSCGFGSINGSMSNTDPLLAPLGSYGGSTQTVALLPGSPAIDAGNNAACADGATVNNQDQRGVARPQGMRCDIGAFESRGFALTRTGGDGQSAPLNMAFVNPLQLTVSSSAGEPVDGGQITFTAPSSGASAAFAPRTTAVITSSGAVSLAVTANETAGSYQVTANTAGAVSPVLFNLTNIARPFSQVLPLLLYQVQATFPISYTVSDPGGSLDRVELWYRWRRSDVPKWSDWALYDSAVSSPVAFAAPRGAGVYQFYTVAVDTSGNREARPSGYDAKTRFVLNVAGQSRFFYGTAGEDPNRDGPLRGGKVGLWVDWSARSFQFFRTANAYAVRSDVGSAMTVTGSASAPLITIDYEDGKLKLTSVQIDVGADTATGTILDKATGKTYQLGDLPGTERPY